MADQTKTATPAPAAPPPASAQPARAPQPGPTPGSAPANRTVGPAVDERLRSNFGIDLEPPDEPDAAPGEGNSAGSGDVPGQTGETKPTATHTPAGPPAEGQPGEEGPPGATPGQPAQPDADGATPAEGPLPGEDLIATIEGSLLMRDPAEAGGANSIEPLDTPEAIAKATNPDGKASLEDQNRNLQAVLGRQGRALGDLRKQLEQYADILHVDPSTQRLDINWGTLLKVVPPERLEDQFAQQGLKLVPSTDGLSEDDVRLAVADELVKDGELTAAEKLELIENDDGKDARKRQRELDREVERRLHAGRADLQARQAQHEQEAGAYMARLQQLPHIQELLPVMDKLKQLVPTHRALTKPEWYRVVHLLAEHHLTPTRMRSLRDQARVAGRDEALRTMNAAAALPGGEGTAPGGGPGAGGYADPDQMVPQSTQQAAEKAFF